MKSLVYSRTILLSLATVLLVALASPVTYAQTPDGETPVNEGVCDELIGFTPGLYGLCVAFCEAQDCEATLDPTTGEVTFDPFCQPSNPKLLRNYNKRATPSDPPMPCVNVTENECACWTEDELDMIAEANVVTCGQIFPGADAWFLSGFNDDGAQEGVIAQSEDPIFMIPFPHCFYGSEDPLVVRSLSITEEEAATCIASIQAECTSRGF